MQVLLSSDLGASHQKHNCYKRQRITEKEQGKKGTKEKTQTPKAATYTGLIPASKSLIVRENIPTKWLQMHTAIIINKATAL